MNEHVGDSAQDASPMLQGRQLGLSRNQEVIFGPLDFTLVAGEVVLIEGDNGSGKTTLLKILSGLLEPYDGEVLLRGEPLTLARLSHQVALLGHLLGLKLELTALENLRFAIGLSGIRRGITPELALASVGLEGYEDQPVRTLSAGQRKRVALARLLLVPAALWLLDEPYANLDREGIELVNRLLDNHTHRGGAALITSHGAYAYTSGTPRRISLANIAPQAGTASSVLPPQAGITSSALPPQAGEGARRADGGSSALSHEPDDDRSERDA